jgi:hypothetical protein
MVNIECANGTGAGVKTITIFNVLGRKVFTGQMGKQKITVDISNFSKGMYILQVEDGINRLSKIIKE